MKKNKKKNYLVLISRNLLGLMLVVFGLNGFFSFMPNPVLPEAAANLAGALFASGYLMVVVKLLEVVVGLALLFNRFVPLALVVLAPLTINFILFHLFLAPAGIGGALIAFVLNVFLLYVNRAKYKEMLRA